MGEAKRRGTYEQRKALATKQEPIKYQPIIRYRTVHPTDPVYSLLVFLGIVIFLTLGSMLCKWAIHVK